MESVELDDGRSALPSAALDDSTEWRKRIAGKDRALTDTIRQRDDLAAKLAELERRAADAETRAADLEAAAERARLERRFPMAIDLLGTRAPLDDENYLARLESRLAGDKDGERSEGVFYIDPNNPRRSRAALAEPDTADDLVGRLRSMGNPFLEGAF